MFVTGIICIILGILLLVGLIIYLLFSNKTEQQTKTQQAKTKKKIFTPNSNTFNTKAFLCKFLKIAFSVVIIISLIFFIGSLNEPKEVPPSEAESIEVYITRTGSKYHKEKCGYLHSSKIEITLKEAIERFYSPCSRCEPPKIETTE